MKYEGTANDRVIKISFKYIFLLFQIVFPNTQKCLIKFDIKIGINLKVSPRS